MFPAQQETEHRFWMIPEMIAKLLPFLNLKSTLCLAQAHEETQNVLEGALIFKKLLERSSPLTQLHKVENLVAILKLMKDPKPNLPQVLDAICESNSPFPSSDFVRMDCPHHLHSHFISLRGFKLLEKVEGAFGTTEQTVESVSLGLSVLPSIIMAALASRLTRQQQPVTSISVGTIEISNEEQAEDFKTLMQAIPPTTIQLKALSALKQIGPEGWKFLAEALRTHANLLSRFFVDKNVCNGVKREEMRVFWDALQPNGSLSLGNRRAVWRHEGEAGWTGLLQILEELEVEDGMGLDGGMADAQMEADGDQER